MTGACSQLLRAFLRAGVMEQGAVRRPVTGTPQGGVVSPLLGNVYLHRLDRAWRGALRGAGPVRRRRAGDVPVHGAGRGRAGAADRRCWPTSAWSRSRPRPGSCTWRRAARGWTSSASTTGWCGPGPGAERVASPSWPAGPRARRCSTPATASGSLTMRARLAAPVEQVVQDINLFLRGWAGYFRYGNSAHAFDKIRNYALMRLALFIGEAAQARPGLGLHVASTDRPTSSAWSPSTESSSHPDPTGPGGSSRTPPVKGVGEPCAGEPHARFDGRELETEHLTRGTGWHGRPGNRRNRGPGTYQSATPPRQLPTQPTSADARRRVGRGARFSGGSAPRTPTTSRPPPTSAFTAGRSTPASPPRCARRSLPPLPTTWPTPDALVAKCSAPAGEPPADHSPLVDPTRPLLGGRLSTVLAQHTRTLGGRQWRGLHTIGRR